MSIKLVIQPAAVTLDECQSLTFSINGLTKDAIYRIDLENGTDERKLNILECSAGVSRNSSIFIQNVTEFTGKLGLDINNNTPLSVYSIFANVHTKKENKYILTDITAFTLQIKSEHSNRRDDVISVYPPFVGSQDKATIKVSSRPNTRMRFAINNKNYFVHTNYEGNGSISIRAVDIIQGGIASVKTMQKFTLKYSKSEDNFEQIYDTGLNLHYIPDTVKSLQATNIDAEPACAVIDTAPVNGIFLRTYDAFCDKYAVVNDKTIFDTSTSFYNSKIGYCTPDTEVYPAAPVAADSDTNQGASGGNPYNCRIYNSLNVAYANEGYSLAVFSSQTSDVADTASRIYMAMLPSSLKYVGTKTYTGAVVKPYKSVHRIKISNVLIGAKITLSFRLERNEAFDIKYVSILGTINDIVQSVVAIINADERLKEKKILGFAGSGLIEIRSDNNFKVSASAEDLTVTTTLRAGDYLELIADADAIGLIKNNNTNTVVMLNPTLGYETHRILDIDENYNIVYIHMPDGYNNNIGPSITDTIPCQQYVLMRTIWAGVPLTTAQINEAKGLSLSLISEILGEEIEQNDLADLTDAKIRKILDYIYLLKNRYPSSSKGVLLPPIKDIYGRAVSCAYPDVAIVRKQISDNIFTNFVYIVCQAVIDGIYQLFLTSSPIDDFGTVNFTKWKQITRNYENKNAKILQDKNENIYLVWESDRIGATQLYYTCVGANSRIANTRALTSAIEKSIIQSDSASVLRIKNPSIRLQDDWHRILGNDGKVSVQQSAKVAVEGNVTKDVAMAVFSLQKDEQGNDFLPDFSQLSYQISFNYLIDSSETVLENAADIEDQFRRWRSQFAPAGDYKYKKGNNLYTIGTYDAYFDNFIPICSSLKISVDSLQTKSGGAQSTLVTHDPYSYGDTYKEYNQELKIDGDRNVNHFVLGIIPEKIRFSAKNVETFAQYCTRLNVSASVCDGYNNEINYELNTGRYKLALVLATSENDKNKSISDKNNRIIRILNDLVIANKVHNIKIAVHYSKMSKEYLEKAVINDVNTTADERRFLGNIIVTLDNRPVCAENFFADFSDKYRKFDIALGIPYGQSFVLQQSLPFIGNSYESIYLKQIFGDIYVGPHSIEVNTNTADCSLYDRNTMQMVVPENNVNLISNRSFETTILPFQSTYLLPNNSTFVEDWTVGYGCILRRSSATYQTEGTVAFDDSNLPYASNGYSWIELTGLVESNLLNYGYIQQSVATVVGQEYIVFFNLSLHPQVYLQSQNITKRVEVSAGTTLRYYTLSNYNHATNKMSWKTYQFKFVAEATTTVLKFRNASTQFSNTFDIQYGPQLDDVRMYLSSSFLDESKSQNIYTSIGVSKDVWEAEYFIDAVDKISQIPITLQSQRQNKNASVALDKADKMHIAYQSNRFDSWNIFYTGGKVEADIFKHDIQITDYDSNSLNPSIGIDSLGRKIIAWQDNRDGAYQIYAAVSKTVDDTISDPCKQTFADAYLYRQNIFVDPYDDPYYANASQFACSLKFEFEAPATSEYHFILKFYEDAEYTVLYKRISSKTNIDGWLVNNTQIAYAGLDAQYNQTYTVAYQPSAEDDLSDKIYYVQIEYELSESIADLLSSTNIEILNAYTGLDLRSGKVESNENMKLILEFDGPSPISIISQTQDILNISGIDGVSFASGLAALPGVTKGQKVSSVLVHFDALGDNGSLTSTIKFTEPILALILNGYDLTLTNGIYGFNGITYANLVGTGIESGDFVTVSADRTTLTLDFTVEPAVDQIRVITESTKTELVGNNILYYCQNTQAPKCNLECEYVNNTLNIKNVHFRVTFYANPERTDVIFSTFTKYDNSNWFIGKNLSFPSNGIAVNINSTIAVLYSPEVLPFDLHEAQNKNKYDENITRQSLLCGIPYTVVIESYVDNEFLVVKETTFLCNCADIRNNSWGVDADASEWICSATGFSDIKITDTDNNCLYPQVDTSTSNLAYITWQDYRYTRLYSKTYTEQQKTTDPTLKDISQRAISPDYFFALYDFANDKFLCSGQGEYDRRITYFSENKRALFDQKVFIDSMQNLNSVFHDGQRVYWKACSLGCKFKTEKLFGTACRFTDDTSDSLYTLGSSPQRKIEQYQMIRFAENYKAYTTYLDTTRPIDVINDCLVELDIIGVPGTYAYRLRNENAENWSEWLPINTDLPTQQLKQEEKTDSAVENDKLLEQKNIERNFFRAYFIEKERFIAPWITSPNNGLKRICCEVLTFFGKTEAFCIDFMAIYDQLDYKVDLFYDNKFENPLPTFNNSRVVSTVRTSINATDPYVINEERQAVDKVYARVEFKDKQKIQIISKLRTLTKYDLGLTMSVYQQGTNDQENLPLVELYNGVYGGYFNVYRNDGVVNKDGLAMIVVNVPNSCQTNIISEYMRRYNILNTNTTQSSEQRIEIFNNFTTFKDIYNDDDPTYNYGSDEYHRNIKTNIASAATQYRKNSWSGGGEINVENSNSYTGFGGAGTADTAGEWTIPSQDEPGRQGDLPGGSIGSPRDDTVGGIGGVGGGTGSSGGG